MVVVRSTGNPQTQSIQLHLKAEGVHVAYSLQTRFMLHTIANHNCDSYINMFCMNNDFIPGTHNRNMQA